MMTTGLVICGVAIIVLACWGELRMWFFEGLASWRTWAALVLIVMIVALVVWGGGR